MKIYQTSPFSLSMRHIRQSGQWSFASKYDAVFATHHGVISGGICLMWEYKKQEKSKSGGGQSGWKGPTQNFPTGDQGSSSARDQMLRCLFLKLCM